jgi:hypothetical protein
MDDERQRLIDCGGQKRSVIKAKAKTATAGYTKTARKDVKGRVIYISKTGDDNVRRKSASTGKMTWHKVANTTHISRSKQIRGGFDLVSDIKQKSKVYPIDIAECPYIIPTGNVSRGGRVSSFLVTKYDIEFMDAIQQELMRDIPITGLNSLDKVKIALQVFVDTIRLIFDTDNIMIGDRMAEFNRRVEDIRMQFFKCNKLTDSDRNYGCKDDRECVTNVASLFYFVGDCREHEVLLHFLLKLWLKDVNITDVEVRSIYATYHKFDSLKPYPDYDHTHPIIVYQNKIYWVDALAVRRTVLKIGKWNPMTSIGYKDFQINEHETKRKLSLEWPNDLGLEGEIWGYPTDFSGNSLLDVDEAYKVDYERNTYLYGKEINIKERDLAASAKILVEIIREDNYFDSKLKLLKGNCALLTTEGGGKRRRFLKSRPTLLTKKRTIKKTTGGKQ